MYDRERVGKIVSDIERYFSDLQSIGIKDRKCLEDKRNFYAVSMLLFSIINRAIDLGEEAVTARNIGTPSTYKDIFFLLKKGGMINEKMKDELSALSSYRNVFSHEYYRYTEKDVFDALARVGVVKDFVKRIKSGMK